MIADVFVWMVLDDCRYFCVNGFGWLWMVLCGVRWFSVIFSFSSYGESHCLKFKRSRQLWGVLVVSSNNDAKVQLKTKDHVG